MKPAPPSGPSSTDWRRAGVQTSLDLGIGPEQPEPERSVRGPARRGPGHATVRPAISLRIDPGVLAWFKAQGPGYQTRMNAVLKAYRDASL